MTLIILFCVVSVVTLLPSSWFSPFSYYFQVYVTVSCLIFSLHIYALFWWLKLHSLSSCFSLCNSFTPINTSFQYCSWYLDKCTPKFTYASIVVLCQHLTIRLAHTLSLISSFVQDVLSFIVSSTCLILFSCLYTFRAVLPHCLSTVALRCQ
jgi:hypothetical protein